MLGDGLRSIQMRNRREHRIESATHTCTGDTRCEEDLARRWHEADLHPEAFFQSGSFDLEQAKALGRETGICPYALTKSCLPYAEVWIGDVNYCLNPASRNVFEQVYGFNPARTCLIIDEAHNLPRRAADALSHELRATEWLFALEALEAAGIKRQVLAVGRALAQWIDRQKPGTPLPTNKQYEVSISAKILSAAFASPVSITPPLHPLLLISLTGQLPCRSPCAASTRLPCLDSRHRNAAHRMPGSAP